MFEEREPLISGIFPYNFEGHVVTISSDPFVVEALKKLLCGGPITSALLKVLLEKELLTTTGQGLSQRLPQFTKFSKFLFANADILDVRPPNGPGDIIVGLRLASGVRSSVVARVPSSSPTRASIPLPIWLAFTNPDSSRKRFVQRETCVVEHFLTSEADSAGKYDRLSHDPAYIEIKPIAASVQAHWMEEFLASAEIDPGALVVLRNIATSNYSAEVNRIWQAALGKDAQRWRTYRGGRVADFVRQWAAENNVAVGKVLPEPILPVPIAPVPIKEVVPESLQGSSLKNSIHKLIDMLSEEDLRQVVLPLHLAAKFVSR